MKYPVLLVIIFVLSSALTSCGSSTFYVSNSGNDDNDGTSLSTPWRTLRNIEPGNTYLLKCGDKFYFNIKKVDNSLNEKITIASYGQGNKPVVSLFKNINNHGWVKVSNTVWKIDLKNKANYDGFLDTSDTNVGFITIKGKIYGNKVTDTSGLRASGDFFSDSEFLFVCFDSGPLSITDPVKVACNFNIIQLTDNMEIKNLSLEGTGGHAIQGISVENINIENVDIADIGGSYLKGYKVANTRYGNGIEFWASAKNCIVQNCTVHDVYDAALTIQSTKPNAVFENVVFKNNNIFNNEQSFEFWLQGTNSFFKRCKFINNNCANAGFGWSHSVRPYKNSAVHLLCQNKSNGMADLTIANNKFLNAKSGYIFFPVDIPSATMFNSYNNQISLDQTVPIRANDQGYLIRQSEKFIKFFDIEKGSTFNVRTETSN